MIKAIVNADDLGKSHEVNMAIWEALEHRYITSSTIMANSTTWDEVHKVVKDNPQASFGIHLNLTEGKALTNNQVLRKYNIVDDNNCFTKNARIISTIPADLKSAIYQEWDAQLSKIIIEENIAVSHIDGHHHIHTRYQYLEILLQLMKKYKIDRVRNRYETTYSTSRTIVNDIIGYLCWIPCMRIVLDKYKSKLSIISYLHAIVENTMWRAKMKKHAHYTNYFNAYETQVKLSQIGNKISDGSSIELMCHPGHPHFAQEYDMIKTMKLSEIQNNIAYINYRNL